MKRSATPHPTATRKIFRVLAALLAAVLLLGAFPAAMVGMARGVAGEAIFVLCCLWGGIGLAVGALTGRWPGAV